MGEQVEWSLVEKYTHSARCPNDMPNDPEAAQFGLRFAVERWEAAVEAEGCRPIGDHPVAGFDYDPLSNTTTVRVHGRVVPITDEAKLRAAARAAELRLAEEEK